MANIHVWAVKFRVEDESMFFHTREEDLFNITQFHDTVSQCKEQNWNQLLGKRKTNRGKRVKLGYCHSFKCDLNARDISWTVQCSKITGKNQQDEKFWEHVISLFLRKPHRRFIILSIHASLLTGSHHEKCVMDPVDFHNKTCGRSRMPAWWRLAKVNLLWKIQTSKQT